MPELQQKTLQVMSAFNEVEKWYVGHCYIGTPSLPPGTELVELIFLHIVRSYDDFLLRFVSHKNVNENYLPKCR